MWIADTLSIKVSNANCAIGNFSMARLSEGRLIMKIRLRCGLFDSRIESVVLDGFLHAAEHHLMMISSRKPVLSKREWLVERRLLQVVVCWRLTWLCVHDDRARQAGVEWEKSPPLVVTCIGLATINVAWFSSQKQQELYHLSTSDQTGKPAEFKHIIKRRKRN